MEGEYRDYSDLEGELGRRLGVNVNGKLKDFVERRPKKAVEIVPGLKGKMTPLDDSESEGFVSIVMEVEGEGIKRASKNFDDTMKAADLQGRHVEGSWHGSLEDAVKSAIAGILALPKEFAGAVQDKESAAT